MHPAATALYNLFKFISSLRDGGTGGGRRPNRGGQVLPAFPSVFG